MTNLVLSFLLLCFGFFAFAQKKPLEHYNYLLDNSYQPLTIRANIIVLYRTDGTGNFDLEDKEQKNLLNDFLEHVNARISNLIQPLDLTGCYTGHDFLPDTKIRFKYNIVKVKNNYAWNYLNSGSNLDEKKFAGFSPSENWYLKELDDSISRSSDIPKGINVYLTADGNKFDRINNDKGMSYDLTSRAAAQFPTDRKLTRSSQVHLPNRFLKYLYHKYPLPIEYNTTWEETYWWHVGDAKGLAHEFGHILGLSHSNEYYSTNACQYSLMSQKPSHPKNFLPPTEIKKMHWNLTRTNLMQFVTENSHYGVSWQIEKDTIWDKPRRFYNDFQISNGVTLTILDSIILPPQSVIKMNKNSRIIFEGKGKIVDAYGKDFTNFQKHKSAKILSNRNL